MVDTRQLRRITWNWLAQLGHTLRCTSNCIAKQALQWTAHKAIEIEED